MITIDLVGRLGNQMFQYALCRTIAELRGYKFYISKDENNHNQNISNYFDLDMGTNDNSVIQSRFIEDHTVQRYNPDIFNISDNTSIWGFFQTDLYFSNNIENIRKWFSLNIDDCTKEILDKYPVDEYCYIHFRGTDYKNWDSGNMFLPKKYFDDAIERVKKEKSDIKFLIITDDIKLASNYFKEFDIISNEMMVDFKLLYYSKYCIITNSTFSWWPSWLSDKLITVAPDYWLNYNRKHLGFYPIDIKVDKFEYV